MKTYIQGLHPESASFNDGNLNYLNKEDFALYSVILNKIKNNQLYANKSEEYKLTKASELFETTRSERDRKRQKESEQTQQQSPPSSRTRTKKPLESTTHEEFYKTYSYSATNRKQRPRLNTTDPGAQGSSDQQSPTHTFLRTFPDIPEELKEQFYNIFINFPNHLNFPINTGKRQMIL